MSMKPGSQHIIFLLVLLLLCSTAAEGSKSWGIGVIIGEPTGLSLKFWSSRTTAFAAAAAWSFRKEQKLHLHMDYLFHNFRLVKARGGRLPLYIGIGGRVKFEDETRVGVRLPLGACYILNSHPIDIFFEVAPLLDLLPETGFDINASIGIRYFFR